MEELLLKLALEEGWKYQLLTYPNPAVGAAALFRNRLFVAAHREAGGPHGELALCWQIFKQFHPAAPELTEPEAIWEHLYHHHDGFFREMRLAVTLEPCNHTGKTPSCAQLLAELKPAEVIVGTRDPIPGHRGGLERLRQAGVPVKLLNSWEAEVLIEPFRRWSSGSFKLFKVAQTLNGVVSGGYISSPDSLKWVHKLRSKVDGILIGGRTLRTDTPRLDSRLIEGRAPTAIILTQQPGQIPRSVPLFKVPEREVVLVSSVEEIDALGFNFILVEGGPNLYPQLRGWVDWSLFIIAPKFWEGERFPAGPDLTPLWSCKRGVDTFLWFREGDR